MLSETTQRRFDELREKLYAGTISNGEQTELTEIIQELRAAESKYLGPATEAANAETGRIEQQTEALADIVRRKRRLARSMRRYLSSVSARQDALNSELAAVLAGSRTETST